MFLGYDRQGEQTIKDFGSFFSMLIQNCWSAVGQLTVFSLALYF